VSLPTEYTIFPVLASALLTYEPTFSKGMPSHRSALLPPRFYPPTQTLKRPACLPHPAVTATRITADGLRFAILNNIMCSLTLPSKCDRCLSPSALPVSVNYIRFFLYIPPVSKTCFRTWLVRSFSHPSTNSAGNFLEHQFLFFSFRLFSSSYSATNKVLSERSGFPSDILPRQKVSRFHVIG